MLIADNPNTISVVLISWNPIISLGPSESVSLLNMRKRSGARMINSWKPTPKPTRA